MYAPAKKKGRFQVIYSMLCDKIVSHSPLQAKSPSLQGMREEEGMQEAKQTQGVLNMTGGVRPNQ